MAAAIIRYLQVPCLYILCLWHKLQGFCIDCTSAWCAETIAQVRDGLSGNPELKSHPLAFPQVKVSELQSGWLVDALQDRFPQAGVSPVTFSVQPFTWGSAKLTPSGLAMFVKSQLVEP